MFSVWFSHGAPHGHEWGYSHGPDESHRVLELPNPTEHVDHAAVVFPMPGLDAVAGPHLPKKLQPFLDVLGVHA